MNEIVRKLVGMIDEDTKVCGTDRILVLIGNNESQYLKAIKRRCEKLGLRCEYEHESLEARMENDCVFIPNCDEGFDSWCWAASLVQDHDIDRVRTDGCSCCAEACGKIIYYGFSSRKRLITIAGRGHSQKGLCEALRAKGDAVLAVCSDSDPMAVRLSGAHSDIIVNTSSDVVWEKPPHDLAVILDVCGSLEPYKDRYAHYISQRDIGALNVSILLNRFVREKL